MKKTNFKLIQPRSEIKKDPAQVGKAVFDILSKENSVQEVGETLEGMTPRYYKELFATIEANKSRMENLFYIIVLRKKEPWALNVLRQWFVARQSMPSAKVLREDYPNHDHDVWRINSKESNVTLEWTLPTAQDCATIIKNKHLYDADLVKWIEQFNVGRLT